MSEVPVTPPGGGEGESSPEWKTVVMPGRDEMVDKLKEAGLYGQTEQGDRVYDRFIAQVAGNEKVGGGLVMAWELSLYDELRGYPPLMRSIMRMNFNRVIDAVTLDSEVAAEAKRFMKEAEEEARRQSSGGGRES